MNDYDINCFKEQEEMNQMRIDELEEENKELRKKLSDLKKDFGDKPHCVSAKVEIKKSGSAYFIHLPANVRRDIGIPENMKFKIFRDGDKVKLEEVKL